MGFALLSLSLSSIIKFSQFEHICTKSLFTRFAIIEKIFEDIERKVSLNSLCNPLNRNNSNFFYMDLSCSRINIFLIMYSYLIQLIRKYFLIVSKHTKEFPLQKEIV